jgi:hypothetical protein
LNSINTGNLAIDAQGSGISETRREAWLWSGEIQAGETRIIEISYHATNLSGIRYSILSDRGVPIRSHRVEIEYENSDHLYLESSKGPVASSSTTTVWERNDFLPPDFYAATLTENRNVYSSLGQLVEIGPLVSLLFMISTLSLIMTRRSLTPLQVMTISAGFSFYFPLIIYLSALFRFNISLLMALVIPGVLLLNYSRWLLGIRVGLIGGITFLALFQVFPTLAAFAGWNRGLVLLTLGVATLFVVINLQNHTLKNAAIALALLVFTPGINSVSAADIQVLIPSEIVSPVQGMKDADAPLISFSPVHYEMSIDQQYAEVTASLKVTVIRGGTAPIDLFSKPVHLSSWEFPKTVRMTTSTNRIQIQAHQEGIGDLRLVYRVPIIKTLNDQTITIPFVNAPSGTFHFQTDRSDLEFQGGHLWNKTTDSGITEYEVGVIGNKHLAIVWPTYPARRFPGSTSLDKGTQQGRIYGIRIVESSQLTVIHSDGTCIHLAQFIIPSYHSEPFQLELPEGSTIISASVDDSEIPEPIVVDNRCIIPMNPSQTVSGPRQISLRLSYPSVRLGFIGFADFELPNPNANIGTLKWLIAFPSGFRPQIITSGLDPVKGDPEELKVSGFNGLNNFGDLGKVITSNPVVRLSKNLVSPRIIQTRLKYYQTIDGITE